MGPQDIASEMQRANLMAEVNRRYPYLSEQELEARLIKHGYNYKAVVSELAAMEKVKKVKHQSKMVQRYDSEDEYDSSDDDEDNDTRMILKCYMSEYKNVPERVVNQLYERYKDDEATFVV